jgi:hypothetical protein
MDELSDRWKVGKSWLYKQTRQSGDDAIPKIKIGKYLRFEPEKVDSWLLSQQNNG